MKFAKLFDLVQDTQVLATKIIEEEDREAPYKLKLATDYRGIYVEAILGFNDEIKCTQAFEDFDAINAQEFFSQTVSIIEEEE